MSIQCEEAISAGECHGDCCGIIPFQKEFYESVERQKAVTGKRIKNIYIIKEMVMVVTDDLHCVFLDRETRQCRIYNQRPDVCRKYGEDIELPCPYFGQNGERRTRADRKRIYREMSVKQNRVKSQLQRAERNMHKRRRKEKADESSSGDEGI